MTIKVIFYCNWGENSSILLEKYKKITSKNKGLFLNIEGVDKFEDADYYIFLEGIPNNINIQNINKNNIICLPREPFGEKNWLKHNIKYGYTYKNVFHVFTYPQFINKTYDELINLKYFNKNKIVSSITSNKRNGPGYILRRNFLININKKYPGLCDMYGYGWENELSESYKGELGKYHNKNSSNNMTKFDALNEYKYSICIENCSKDNYFTEKITDSILCWTVPIYYGCSNIEKYFPKDSYYYVDITKNNCYEEIIKIINKPITEQNIIALKEARKLILNKYNIWNVINNLVDINKNSI